MGQGEFEVLVIGGGPAGLSAALYLARFDRRVGLVDAGGGRSSWHQINHNYLGFPAGVRARRLRALGRRQLAEYGQVTMLAGRIERLRRTDDGFEAAGPDGQWSGRAVVLCTGVIDHYPQFDGWEQCVGRSLFWCITCDGYACKGNRVVVVGNSDDAAAETLQLTRFTDRLALVTNSDTRAISPHFLDRLGQRGVPVVVDRIARAAHRRGQLQCLYLASGRELPLDQLFSVQGATPQSELARQVGARCSEAGYILVDTEQKTSVPGLFAAGDVTRLHSHQVTTAVHEGGQAAQAANCYLYPPELLDD
jgi:thioredoxin reductase (NADPH)